MRGCEPARGKTRQINNPSVCPPIQSPLPLAGEVDALDRARRVGETACQATSTADAAPPRRSSPQALGYRIWNFQCGPHKNLACFELHFSGSSLRTQGPIRRGLSFWRWSRDLSSSLRPGMMGPCVRRDDPLRARARPRPHQRAARFTHMRFPCGPPLDLRQLAARRLE
jgi:hypothetical protein